MRSSRVMFALIALLGAGTQAQQPAQIWTRQSLSQLRSWVSAAPDDALPRPDSSALERAIAGDKRSLARSVGARAVGEPFSPAAGIGIGPAAVGDQHGLDDFPRFDVDQLKAGQAGMRGKVHQADAVPVDNARCVCVKGSQGFR